MGQVQFKEVAITIPENIVEVFQEIENLEEDSCIAGGSLVDFYLGKPFKDIDIFINSRNRSSIINHLRKKHSLRCISGEYTSFMKGESGVYEFSFQGITYQLIFTSYGSKQVERFDLRFKEIFYQSGKAYASVEALSDINNQEINIGIIHSASDTTIRAMNANKKYDFTLSSVSKKRLASYVFIDGAFNEKYYQFIGYNLKTFQPDQETDLIRDLSRMFPDIPRDEFDGLLSREEKISVSHTLALPYDFIMKTISGLEEKIRKETTAYTLEMLYENPDAAAYWRDNIDSPTFLHTVFKQNYRKLGKIGFVNKISSLFQDIDRVMEVTWMTGNLEIVISDKYVRLRGLDFSKYLERKYVSIAINQRDFIYDLEKGEFLSNLYSDRRMNLAADVAKQILEDSLVK